MRSMNKMKICFEESLAIEKEDLSDIYLEELKNEIVSAISKSAFLASSDILFKVKLLKNNCYLFDVKFLAKNLFIKYNNKK